MAIKVKLKLEGEHAKRLLRGENPADIIRPSQAESIGEREGNRMAKHWMQGAVKRKGKLTQRAKAAGMSTMAYARKHEHDSGPRGSKALQIGDEARFALRAEKERPKGAAAHRAAEKGARTRKRHARLPRAAAHR